MENDFPQPVKSIILPVILAGGVGSRLWPLSREAHPKPFIKLDDGQSLIQKTYLRAVAINGVNEILTVTNRDLFFYTKDEYENISTETKIQHSFLLEPFGRNSAAAIALAAHYADKKYGSQCTLLILPADHLIDDLNAFSDAVQNAIILADKNKLVTFGIQPCSPKTGYGYIESEGQVVKRFVEKPDIKTAKSYFSSGNYFWNSGMFCMNTHSILEEMKNLCPDIFIGTFKCIESAKNSNEENWNKIEINTSVFEDIRSISIDYAVFEKSKNVAIIPCNIGWSDIGSWIEFGALHDKDQIGNHVFGEVLLEDVDNCIVHSESRLIAGVGLRNLIIADTSDALLVAHKDHAQDICKIVDKLKLNNNPCYKLFPCVHRPWGTYTELLQGVGFKLKRIDVKPNSALSLQSHKYRSEHWIVVSGKAKITNENEVFELEHNQSTYIPEGHKHRLENIGKDTLILIEVQCGHYLEEDDIVRYEDIYGR